MRISHWKLLSIFHNKLFNFFHDLKGLLRNSFKYYILWWKHKIINFFHYNLQISAMYTYFWNNLYVLQSFNTLLINKNDTFSTNLYITYVFFLITLYKKKLIYKTKYFFQNFADRVTFSQIHVFIYETFWRLRKLTRLNKRIIFLKKIRFGFKLKIL